ncbi:ComEA family DNA-binding protein [Nonomuraea africana]|uniref:Competence protein ComEA n=1 Tax=Nonomuraea africana TaxID=46171 RepID=A0ABR9KK52_9ACTN|nr:ComEA family DNA-binding protein [Nonomuraea africana]MBE1562394.1 competence protein ComEA [Nonomuraea africana]
MQGRAPADDPPSDGPSGLSPRIPQSFAAFRAAVSAQAPGLDPGRPGLRVLLVLGVVAAVVGGFYVWRASPTPEPLAAPSPISGSAAPPPATSASASAALSTSPEVMVHVAGKVRRPGVYTLPGGSRVTDAVEAAGGVRSGAPTGSVNLARRLVDGEQIVVGAPGGAGGGVVAAPPAVLDLNSATPEQLEELPGVGEVLAARIAEFRTTHGGFRSVEQLREVSGIGERKYAELKDKVRV